MATRSLPSPAPWTELREVFHKFRTGVAKVLITTNVLARGIDVQTVTMVINYNVPDLPGGAADYETYLHRIGRTGRFGRTGAALTFVHDRKSYNLLTDICKHFNVEISKLGMLKPWNLSSCGILTNPCGRD
jgi:ATP-dependent RNA helicase DDX19/DBP5